MKPSIPETGTVIGLKDDKAIILITGSGACKGCGAGKIGLCKPGGGSMVLQADNALGAYAGDTVVVGIGRNVRIKGYLLAYIIPFISLVAGTVIGHVAGKYLGVSFIDVPAGFLSLTAVSFFTFRRLRLLDRTSAMRVSRVVSACVFEVDPISDEERRFEEYFSSRVGTPKY